MRILHIEDAELFADLVRKVCAEASLEVETVSSLTEAKLELAAGHFDVLLIDLNLPDSSGLQTVEELSTFGIPMIVLAGDPTEELIEQAVQLGVSDYIPKDSMTWRGLALKIQFVHQKFQAQKAAKRKSLSFHGIAALKPYLACSVL